MAERVSFARRAISFLSTTVWLLLLALLAGLNGWFITSVLVSVAAPHVTHYVLVARPFSELAVWCVCSLLHTSLALLLSVERDRRQVCYYVAERGGQPHGELRGQ